MAKVINEVDTKTINLFGKGTTITGDIVSDGDIRIDGELKGNLHLKGRLVIGPTGLVVGDINCRSCEIAGQVTGKVIVSELLSLKSTSSISGEITTNKLSIEPGAIFSGTCSMENGLEKNDQ